MSYDAWRTGYYEDDRETYCADCEEYSSTVRRSKEYLKSIVEKLYSKDQLDVFRLEDDLAELCAFFDVKIGQGLIQIERKKDDGQLFQEWISFNNQFLANGM